MKKTILLSIFISFGYLLKAQELQNGLVLPNNYDASEFCCVYVPNNGFNVFNNPNGQKIGLLTKDVKINTGNQSNYRIYLDRTNDQPEQIDLSNFQEVRYEEWAITYFERADGFIRITNNQNSYWINEQEVIDKNFKIQEWPEFLVDNVGQLLGFYAKAPGLNLRAAPNVQSEILKTLKGNLFEITPTKERSGLWMKVKIKKYKEHICQSSLSEDEILDYELNGWIKIVDDSGTPNVWYYSRGC